MYKHFPEGASALHFTAPQNLFLESWLYTLAPIAADVSLILLLLEGLRHFHNLIFA